MLLKTSTTRRSQYAPENVKSFSFLRYTIIDWLSMHFIQKNEMSYRYNIDVVLFYKEA